MKFANFEPGDATRYVVGVGRLSASEANDGAFPGGKAGEVIFTFGTGGGPLNTWIFARAPHDFGYYHSKMSRGKPQGSEMYTLYAGWIVLHHLMGLDEQRPYKKEVLAILDRWNSQSYARHWIEQLAPLRRQLLEGTLEAAGAL